MAHERGPDAVPVAQRDEGCDGGDEDRRGRQRAVAVLAQEGDDRDQEDPGAEREDALAGRLEPATGAALTALRQMDLGATRRDAFLALRERNESEALSTFIGAQLQAEELGVPLSEALNDIALDMRRSAAQNARRRAARAAPRISLIVTTLIVPGSIILILASMLLGTDVLDSGVLGGG